MDPTADLLRRIEEFIAREGMTPTAFGRRAVGDPRFVFSIRGGRELRRATRDRVSQFIAAQQPASAV